MRSSMLLGLAFLTMSCASSKHEQVALPPLDSSQQPVALSYVNRPYRVQPGDLLRVKFLFHPELDIRVPVRPDGNITLQVAGQMQAAGLTTTELEELIRERSSERLRDPEISVVVAQVADSKVYVGGEVRAPGFVIFREGMTPLQAILDRGGFTDTARMDSVLRLSSTQAYEQGTRLDFTGPLSDGTPEGTQLASGDMLYVPRSFIGDVDTFVRLYIREVLPIPPRVGFGTTF